MKKKVLVTGADGQLGKTFQKISNEEKNENLEFIFTDKDTLDITNIQNLRYYFSGCSPDYIINCAGYTNVDGAEEDKMLAHKINSTASINLSDVANEYGAKLILISTDYVFDGTKSSPYTEKDAPNPKSVYGKTKLHGELVRSRHNHDIITIRTSWLYSEFGQNFVSTMLRLGEELEEISVVFDQVGTPTFASDLAIAVMSIINRSEESGDFKRGIYHYSNEGVCSWYDFALEIFSQKGIECKVKPITTRNFKRPARRPAFSVLDKHKIKKTFGVEVPYWKDSLKKMLML